MNTVRSPSNEADSDNTKRTSFLEGFLLVVVLAIYLAHVRFYNFISDDAFITLRYAKNLVAGYGLVFNPGERVEGFTSPLWTLILAAANFAGFDLLQSARVLGVLWGGLALIFTYKLAQRVVDHPRRHLLAAIAPLVLASNGAFACWAASGMETPMFVCLLVASVFYELTDRNCCSGWVVCALLLTRPEGVLAWGGLALFRVWKEGMRAFRQSAGWFAVCGGVLVGLFVGRYHYYGDWLPNTYYAKTGGGVHQWHRGLQYLMQYAADHEGLVVMVILAAYGLFAHDVRLRLVSSLAILLCLAVILVGGDGLPMYRFAIPPQPFFAVLLARFVADLNLRSAHVALERHLMFALNGALLATVLFVHLTPPVVGPHYALYEYQKKVEIPLWTAVGKWLRAHAQRGDSVAAVPIGAISYYSDLPVIDMMGLTDRHIARRKMPDMGKGWAGHEKRDGPYVLSRRPTYLLLGNIDVTNRPRDPDQWPFIPYFNPAIWERERDIYETELLRKMYEPRSAMIAPGLYLNYYHLKKEYRGTDGLR